MNETTINDIRHSMTVKVAELVVVSPTWRCFGSSAEVAGQPELYVVMCQRRVDIAVDVSLVHPACSRRPVKDFDAMQRSMPDSEQVDGNGQGRFLFPQNRAERACRRLRLLIP